MDERLPDGRSVDETMRNSRWVKPEIPLGGQPIGGPAPTGVQTLTPRNREAITRPRSVFAPPSPQPTQTQQPYNPMAVLAPDQQPTFDGKPIFAEQVNGEPFGSRDRRTQPRDFVADDEQYLRDLENKPRGWKDTTVDVLRALNSVWGSNPKAMTPTKREREIAETQQRLGRGLTIDKAQVAQSRVDQGQQKIDLTAEQNKARRENWKSMDADRRKKTIVAQYKAGMLNDPESLEQAARELNIPGELQPAFIRGEMRDALDVDGNLIQVNRRTGDVTTTGEKSYEVTKEKGRTDRAQASQEGAMERTRMTQEGANERAALKQSEEAGGFTPIQQQNRIDEAAKLHAEVERNRKIAQRASKALGTATPNNPNPSVNINGESYSAAEALEQALDGANEAAGRLKAGYSDLYDAGEGEADQSGKRWAYSQPKPRSRVQGQQAQPSGRTVDGAIQAFRKKVGRAPTAEEIAKMKAALGQ